MNIIISTTGKINGRGCDIYKSVTKLTKAERTHVKNGGIVLIRDTKTHPTCTPFKLVTMYKTKSGEIKFGHKNYYEMETKGGTK